MTEDVPKPQPPPQGTVATVTGAASRVLLGLEPAMLAMLLLVAVMMGIWAYSNQQQRAYQHEIALMLMNACIGGLDPLPNQRP